MKTGGCQCGAVRYEITAESLDVYCCHCRECQKQSASAHGISVIVAMTAFSVVQGKPAHWSRSTDSGNTLDCYFCPTCGSRLWHQDSHDADAISVKGGSLDEPPDLIGAKHIWTKRKLPGIEIPEGCVTWPGEPPG